jgi:hypothetical protein
MQLGERIADKPRAKRESLYAPLGAESVKGVDGDPEKLRGVGAGESGGAQPFSSPCAGRLAGGGVEKVALCLSDPVLVAGLIHDDCKRQDPGEK